MGKPIVVKNDDRLEVNLSPCKGFEFTDAKEQVAAISGRRFDWDTKLWLVPATPDNADRLMRTIFPEVDPDLVDWIQASKTKASEDLTTPLAEDAELLIPWATQRCEWQPEVVNDEEFTGLLPYQRAAVDAMARWQRDVLGDDMGLGKTLTYLSAVEEYILRNPRDDGTLLSGPRLVIAPNSVKGSWAREIERWLPDGTPYVTIDGTTPAARHKQLVDALQIENVWIIVNWEQLRVKKAQKKLRNGGTRTVTVMKEPLFEETEWLAVVADEVHKGKNRKSQQTQGLWRIQAPFMAGLTGTAVMNSPDELWAILRWLWPDEYHERGAAHRPGAISYWSFYNEFVDYWEDFNQRRVVTGVRNADGLKFVLKEKVIRRTASILGLKGRKRIYYNVDMTPQQAKLYKEAEKAIWLEVLHDAEEGDATAIKLAKLAVEGASASEMYKIPNGAARFVRLQQILESPALLGGPDSSGILDDLVENVVDSTPEPWTVFCKFKETCYLAKKRLEQQGLNVAVYNGDVDPKERTKVEDAFQRGEVDVIVGTIAAMYQGITLTRGHFQYWVSREVVPDINEQGEARNDRLGQQKQVIVKIPQVLGTVAVDKVEVINRVKERVVRAILPKDKIEEVKE